MPFSFPKEVVSWPFMLEVVVAPEVLEADVEAWRTTLALEPWVLADQRASVYDVEGRRFPAVTMDEALLELLIVAPPSNTCGRKGACGRGE